VTTSSLYLSILITAFHAYYPFFRGRKAPAAVCEEHSSFCTRPRNTDCVYSMRGKPLFSVEWSSFRQNISSRSHVVNARKSVQLLFCMPLGGKLVSCERSFRVFVRATKNIVRAFEASHICFPPFFNPVLLHSAVVVYHEHFLINVKFVKAFIDYIVIRHFRNIFNTLFALPIFD